MPQLEQKLALRLRTGDRYKLLQCPIIAQKNSLLELLLFVSLLVSLITTYKSTTLHKYNGSLLSMTFVFDRSTPFSKPVSAPTYIFQKMFSMLATRQDNIFRNKNAEFALYQFKKL